MQCILCIYATEDFPQFLAHVQCTPGVWFRLLSSVILQNAMCALRSYTNLLHLYLPCVVWRISEGTMRHLSLNLGQKKPCCLWRQHLLVHDVSSPSEYCNFWILPGTPISTVSEDFSRLFENDQGGLWRLLWEVHLEEAVHQPCQIQIMLEDQIEKQAEGRTGNRSPGSKKSPAGRWNIIYINLWCFE